MQLKNILGAGVAGWIRLGTCGNRALKNTVPYQISVGCPGGRHRGLKLRRGQGPATSQSVSRPTGHDRRHP